MFEFRLDSEDAFGVIKPLLNVHLRWAVAQVFNLFKLLQKKMINARRELENSEGIVGRNYDVR